MAVDLKNLKKLALLCRQVGIKKFKSMDFEFELTEDEPISFSPRKESSEAEARHPAAGKYIPDTQFISETELTPEQLLNWSVRDEAGEEVTKAEGGKDS